MELLIDPDAVRFVLCDLDGVVWLAQRPIEGAVDAIARLRTSGRRVLFVTNNSKWQIADQEAVLARIGVPAEGDVVTSAQAAAQLVASGEEVLVCGGPGVVEAVEARGARATLAAEVEPSVVRDRRFDAVVVGLHDDFGYASMTVASAAIRAGARFVATNDDATYPTPSGPIPGAGAIVASIVTASETMPTVAGKPHRPMADLVGDRCGPDFSPAAALMVGDRASTDGAFASTLGCPFALVRTGVSSIERGLDAAVPVALDAASLAAVADLLVTTGATST